jgi:biotin carboxyl carrier protein
MADPTHALVLPDADFRAWYTAAQPYLNRFPRVVVVRGPRGNDLNRYHTVTAVQAPGVWVGNNALAHVRRAYPSVVRIDVIAAATPGALTAAFAPRIAAGDRYAESVRDGHLWQRFVIGWIGDGRPAAIVTRFGTPIDGRLFEAVECSTAAGALVRAPIAGTVARLGTDLLPGYGAYLQIAAEHTAQPGVSAAETFTVTIANLESIRVREGQRVNAGDVLGPAAAARVRLVVQGPGGRGGFALASVHDPAPLIHWPELRVTPSADGVRIREKPGTTFRGLGQVYIGDMIESLEPHGRTLEKLGRDDSWLRVRTPLNIEGYGAAWLFQAATRETIAAVNLTGMNLDALHPLGRPAPERMGAMGWVRMPYKATPSQGFASLEAAHAFYEPILRGYARSGQRVIAILTHQTFGEGAGFSWDEMYSARRDRWNDFLPPFLDAVRSIARRYAGKDIIHAYQIWNEQDTPFGKGVAAVPLQPEDCARITAECVRVIRSIDPQAKIITGGHIGGPSAGAAYARAMLAAIPPSLRPDGVACHSYGRGAPTSSPRYTSFGAIGDDISAYSALIPDAPVWITEWGVLDMPDDAPEAIARYAVEFLRHVKTVFRRRVAAACWYAFADGMHNGYGLVDREDRPKFPLYDQYIGS